MIKSIFRWIITPSIWTSRNWNPFRNNLVIFKLTRNMVEEASQKSALEPSEIVTFEQKIKIEGITEDELQERFFKHLSVAALQVMILLFIIAGVVALVTGRIDSFLGQSLLGMFSIGFSGVLISCTFLMVIFKNLHYAKQIRCRHLFSFIDFLKFRQNWNPTSSELKLSNGG